MKRCASAICLILVIFCLLGSCGSPEDRNIICQDLTFALPTVFLDLSAETYAKDADFLYGRDKLVVMGLAEKKSDLKEMTLEEYTGLVISGNKLACTPVKTPAGYQFTYETAVGGTPYTYSCGTVETPERFWIVQCYCPSGDAVGYEDMIEEILGSLQPYGAVGN